MTVITTEPAWSARCDCYDGHASASGRCRCRNSGSSEVGKFGVTDPTRHKGDKAICESCRANCPAGCGDRLKGGQL